MRIRFHRFFVDFLYVFLRKKKTLGFSQNAPSAYPFAQSYLWYKAPQITGILDGFSKAWILSGFWNTQGLENPL